MLPGHRAWPAGQRVVGGGVRHSTDARGMVALHIVALLLTLLGSLVVTHEVWSGRRRWVATFGTTRPSSGEVSGVVSVRSTAWGSVGLVGETVEARLAALEERQQKDHMALVTRIMGVEQKMPDVAANAAREVENRLRPQIADVLAYLTGQGQRAWWLPWWAGPVLLLPVRCFPGSEVSSWPPAAADAVRGWSGSTVRTMTVRDRTRLSLTNWGTAALMCVRGGPPDSGNPPLTCGYVSRADRI